MNFIKTNQLCSNVYLLDENLCAGNTLNLINYNTVSLTSALISLQRYSNQWGDLYTTLTTYSAKFVSASTNFAAFTAKWIDASNVVSSLSADWIKPFTIYYPKKIKIDDWLAKTNQQQVQELQTWLFFNFDPTTYAIDQIANVTVLLYQENAYTLNHKASYNELCSPNGGGAIADCTECARPYSMCNHHGGAAGYKACDNLYDYCTAQNTGSTGVSFSCQGNGGKLLSLNYSNNLTDISMARSVNYKFKASNNNWIYIS
jgi:hypothetical protein